MLQIDRYLAISIAISIGLHTAIFLPIPQLRKPLEKRKTPGLEVTYVITKKIVPKTMAPAQKEPPPVQYKAPDQAPKKELPKKEIETKALKPEPAPQAKPKDNFVQIEIPPELPKEKEAIYIDYYQSIRQRIRDYVEKNYMRFIDYGEVCLHFVLLPDGSLKSVRIVEERSTNNPQLREIVKRSVREAAPFFPFPKGLGSTDLSFNVTVSFELDE